MERMEEPKTMTPDETQGVAVFAEQRHGKLANVTLEIMAKGRELADALGEPLCAVLFGSGVDTLAEELQHYGPDKVFVVDDEKLGEFNDEAYSAAMVEVVKQAKPSILIAGMTNIGRSFMPKAATHLGVGIVTGCTDLKIGDDKNLIASKPSFGATVFADVVIEKARPQIVTARQKAFDPAEKQDAASGEIVKVALLAAELKCKLLESVADLAGAVDLADADIIVSGGRGIGGPEFFAQIKELADAMGGVVGASRAAVDAGWIEYSHQVGQTGKQVKPKVYVACGISGAIQHLVGMRQADVIVAINRDPEAPIFKVATYGIVGDVKQIVPALAQRFQQG